MGREDLLCLGPGGEDASGGNCGRLALLPSHLGAGSKSDAQPWLHLLHNGAPLGHAISPARSIRLASIRPRAQRWDLHPSPTFPTAPTPHFHAWDALPRINRRRHRQGLEGRQSITTQVRPKGGKKIQRSQQLSAAARTAVKKAGGFIYRITAAAPVGTTDSFSASRAEMFSQTFPAYGFGLTAASDGLIDLHPALTGPDCCGASLTTGPDREGGR
ncbi:unnamed protein product [Lampetra fluviatilis]